jgi:hypothetical protein
VSSIGVGVDDGGAFTYAAGVPGGALPRASRAVTAS